MTITKDRTEVSLLPLWNWIKSILTPNQNKSHSYQSKHRPKHHPIIKNRVSSPAPTTTSKINRPKNSDNSTEESVNSVLETHERPDSLLVILYLDERHKMLLQPQVIGGQIGNPINFQVQQIDNYSMTGIDGYTANFPSEYAIMTLRFSKQHGKPVISYAIDYDTNNLLAPPDYHEGLLNEPFSIEPTKINHYKLIRVQGQMIGAFNQQVQAVFAFYRQQDWQTVQEVGIYIKLNKQKTIFNEPDGDQQTYTFPKNSIWRVFREIVKVDGTTWYNLGGPQWLTSNWTIIRTQPMQPALDTKLHSFHAVATQLDASIDFVQNESVNYYDQPYGQIIGKLAHGTKVKIIEQLRDEQKLLWYRLDNNGIISEKYIKLTK